MGVYCLRRGVMQAQDLPELKTKIAARVHGSPQSLRLLALAIAELRGGMEKLGSMGYPVYLSETPGFATPSTAMVGFIPGGRSSRRIDCGDG